jgi:hypothetical protein
MTDQASTARADLIGGAVWIALGGAIAVLSWNMDRLAQLGINPYTVPGLVPGMLGAGLVALGALLAARAIRAGALGALSAPFALDRVGMRRLLLTGAICIGYAVLLLGRMPFWLATAVFVFAFIAAFDFADRRAQGQLARGAAIALVAAILTGVIVMFVFEDLFLVRLP